MWKAEPLPEELEFIFSPQLGRKDFDAGRDQREAQKEAHTRKKQNFLVLT